MNNQQTELIAGSSCNIDLEFNGQDAFSGTDPKGNYNHAVFKIAADVDRTDITASLSTLVQNYLGHNAIIFGDSLSDVGNTSSAPYTNPATSGKFNWAQDLVHAKEFPEGNLIASAKLGDESPIDSNIDFAVGGATTANLNDQLKSYEEKLKQKPDAVIWMGGNDLLYQAFSATLPILQQESNKAVSNIMASIARFNPYGY